MSEFQYRPKTWQTPKTQKGKSKAGDTVAGAVSPSTFRSSLRARTIVEDQYEDVSFDFRKPLSQRRKKTDSPAASPKKRGRPRKEDTKVDSVVNKENESETAQIAVAERPAKQQRITNKDGTTSKLRSPPEEQPLVRKSKHRSVDTSPAEQYLKEIFDSEIQRLSKEESASNAYIVNALQQLCKDFLAELGSIPEIEKITRPKKQKPTKQNSQNIELSKKQSGLFKLIQQFSEEEKQWQRLSNEVKTPASNIAVPAEPDDEPVSVNKSLQHLSLQLDQLKPTVKELEWLNHTADQVCSSVIQQVHSKDLQHFEKTDAKSLIKSFAI